MRLKKIHLYFSYLLLQFSLALYVAGGVFLFDCFVFICLSISFALHAFLVAVEVRNGHVILWN